MDCPGFVPLSEPWWAQFAGREQQSLSVPPPLCCLLQPRRRKRSGARQGLRNRWLSTGLLSHFAHRMDSFLGKNPSFWTEGGYCPWAPAPFVAEAGRCVDGTGSAWV